MRQQAFRFGRGQDMLGILALPAADGARRAVICWNTGISHRIGANRLNVELSQTLTRLGLPVFRFDLRGHGDSEAGDAELQSATYDVQEAMNHLQTVFGYDEFILLGLCSGAIEAHYVAAADRRVVGLCMIDTYAHRIGAYYRHYVLSRLFSRRFYARLWRKIFKKETPRESGAADDQFFVPFPKLESIREDFRNFVSRNLSCLVIYTHSYEYVFNHKEQFRAMLGDVDAESILQVELHDQADHLYTDIYERQKLLDSVSRWVQPWAKA